MNTKFSLIQLSAILLIIVVEAILSSPVIPKADEKPPKCPYGKCFLDRCERICSCVPNEGAMLCTKEFNIFKNSDECVKPTVSKDNCPFGRTYRPDHWPKQFLCYCNNDASQTYECLDLKTQAAADADELLKYSRSNAHRAREILEHVVQGTN